MSKHQIASLASKLLGIYFAVYSLGYLSSLGMQFTLGNPATIKDDVPFMLTVSLGCFFIVLGVGLLLLLRAERVAVFLVGQESSESDTLPSTGSGTQMIAYTTVGLFLTIQALPHFINLTFNLWFSLVGWSYRSGSNARTYIDLFASLLQVALGVWLLLGAKGLATMLRKVRGDSEM